MPRHLRFQSTEWSPHLITARCTQGQNLLSPDEEVNALITGALARSLEQHRHEIELHHYAVLSNHLHLLLSARDAHAKARFMCHLSGTLARELCRRWGTRDHLWEGRYHSHELLDEEALVDAYKYLFKNSVKEGLVAHPREWPGLHGYAQLCEGASVVGRWLDRTRWGCAQRTQRGRAQGEEAYVREAPVTLTRPRCWAGWAAEVFRARCAGGGGGAVGGAGAGRGARGGGGGRAAGGGAGEGEGAGVVARPKSRSPRPLCRAGCGRRWAEFLEGYRAFAVAFKEASGRLRAAVAAGARLPRVAFPAGGVPLYIGS